MDIVKVFDLKSISCEDIMAEAGYARQYDRGFKDGFNDVHNDVVRAQGYLSRIPGYYHGYLDAFTKIMRRRLNEARR